MRAVDKHRRRAELRLYPRPKVERTHVRRRPRATTSPILRLRLIKAGLVVVCIIGLVIFAFTSSFFHVRYIRMVGVKSLTPEEEQITRTRVLGAVPVHTNLFLASSKRIRSDISTLPWITGVDVSRKMPGSLFIEVKPRVTTSILCLHDGQWELDSSGLVIRAARQGVKTTEIVSALPVAPALGKRIEDPCIVAATSVIARLSDLFKDRLVKIEVDQSSELCLNMEGGTIIRLGSTDELPLKLSLLRRIYETDPDTSAKVQEINLRSPEAPVCIPRPVAGSEQNAKSTDSVFAHKAGHKQSPVAPQYGVTD